LRAAPRCGAERCAVGTDAASIPARPAIADFASALNPRLKRRASPSDDARRTTAHFAFTRKAGTGDEMGLGTILLIILILALIGALPSWPYSSGWGYAPSGVVGAIVIVVLVLLLMGRL
jgi:hypothetical protein